MKAIVSEVENIVYAIENGISYEDCELEHEIKNLNVMSCETIHGEDFLEKFALDIQYIHDDENNCVGGRVLLKGRDFKEFRGVRMWIDTQKKTVEADMTFYSYNLQYCLDIMGIGDAIIELYNKG